MEIKKDHVFVDVDFNELLIGESAADLNRGVIKEVYAFTKEQVDEIVKRCRFKTSVRIEDGVYIIRRLEAYKPHRKNKKRGVA